MYHSTETTPFGTVTDFGFVILSAFVRKFGKDVGFVIGLVFLPFVFWPMLGFGSAEYEGRRGKRRRRPPDEDEDEDEDDRPRPKRRARDDEDEEEEEERPRRPSKPARARDDEDEDDEPPPRPKRRPRDDDDD